MLGEIVPPSDCPSCGSSLRWINQLLYCKSTVCGAQKQKKIEHFAKTLKIKGLGPAAIEKLDIQDFDQLYELDVDYITSALNSEKIAIKLKKEIDNSKSAPLNLVLPAFGIPLIGNTATKKLSETVENITEINADTCKRAGLGPKATENLMSWLSKDFYAFYDGCLPFDFKFVTEQKVERKGVVCISGRLKSFKTKADATETLS